MRHVGLFQNIKTTLRKHGTTMQIPRRKAIYTTKAIRLRETRDTKTTLQHSPPPLRWKASVTVISQKGSSANKTVYGPLLLMIIFF